MDAVEENARLRAQVASLEDKVATWRQLCENKTAQHLQQGQRLLVLSDALAAAAAVLAAEGLTRSAAAARDVLAEEERQRGRWQVGAPPSPLE